MQPFSKVAWRKTKCFDIREEHQLFDCLKQWRNNITGQTYDLMYEDYMTLKNDSKCAELSEIDAWLHKKYRQKSEERTMILMLLFLVCLLYHF